MASDVLFEKTIEVRWADCDANQHMRHSAYSDLCGHTRMAFLHEIGIGSEWLRENNIGPVLFKEETEYMREAHVGELLRVTVEAGQATGFTKSIQMLQHIMNADGEIAAVHRCAVGWMDLAERKIVELPAVIRARFPVQGK